MVKVLDTTLREGEQTPGVYFDVHIKTAIAELLEEIGVDIIETGHPAVTEEIKQAVFRISHIEGNSLIGAHSRSLKEDVNLALDCGVDFLGIFYCVSDSRLDHHNKSLENAVKNISETIKYAKKIKPDLVIRYTPEDAVRSPFENVKYAAIEASKAGADVISIADTTGYMIPGTENNMYSYVKNLKKELNKQSLSPEIAVHCHNDRGFALANAIDGLRAGASIIDASVLGLGERAGIVDLANLLVVLKNDFNVENNWNLELLPELYNLVSRYSGVEIPVNMPVVGGNSFTHCAGVHTQAALKNPTHYESLKAEIVGRKTKISLDHMSGLSAIYHSLNEIGYINIDKDFALRILKSVKEMGMRGRVVDLEELKHIVNYLKKGQLVTSY